MTISSLQDLNTYAQTPITYDDVRTAQVIFDRGATVDQTLVTPENGKFVSPWGINIETITQPDVAEVEYHLDYSAWADPISVTWSYLPAHMTVTRTNNTWIVSGIENSEDWLYARAATVLPPFGFSGVVAHSAAIHYYSDTQDSTKNIASWDINLTVTQVEYFSVPAPLTYVSNTLYSQLNTCRITTDPEDFDPVWDLRIYSADETLTPVDAIEEMFSDGSAAEATWNNNLNQYIVTGDTGSINEVLDTLDLETRRYADDFKLVFRLANNFTNDLEYQIQSFASRDMISDPVVAAGLSSTPNYIFGGIANPVSHATSSTTYNLIRDPNPTEITATSNASTVPNAIWDPTSTLDSAFDIVPNGGYLLEGGATITAEFGIVPNGGYLLEHEASGMTTNASVQSWPIQYTSEDLVITFDRTGITGSSGDPAQEIYMKSFSQNTPSQNIPSGFSILWDTPGGNQATQIVGTSPVKFPNALQDNRTYATAVISPYTNSGTTYYPYGIEYNTDGSVKYATGIVYGGSSMIASVDSWGNLNPEAYAGICEGGTITSINSNAPTGSINLTSAFENASISSSVVTTLESFDMSNATTIESIFKNTNFNSNTLDSSAWDTSGLTSLRNAFNSLSISELTGMGSWDTSNVTDMSYAFFGTDCTVGEAGIANWDTSSVTNMERMFRNNESFNNNISGWDVSAVTNMEEMFMNTTPYLNPGSSGFDQDISGWDVSAVTNYTNWDTDSNPNWTSDEKPTFT